MTKEAQNPNDEGFGPGCHQNRKITLPADQRREPRCYAVRRKTGRASAQCATCPIRHSSFDILSSLGISSFVITSDPFLAQCVLQRFRYHDGAVLLLAVFEDSQHGAAGGNCGSV